MRSASLHILTHETEVTSHQTRSRQSQRYSVYLVTSRHFRLSNIRVEFFERVATINVTRRRSKCLLTHNSNSSTSNSSTLSSNSRTVQRYYSHSQSGQSSHQQVLVQVSTESTSSQTHNVTDLDTISQPRTRGTSNNDSAGNSNRQRKTTDRSQSREITRQGSTNKVRVCTGSQFTRY